MPHEPTAEQRWHTPMNHEAPADPRDTTSSTLYDDESLKSRIATDGRASERTSHARTHHLSRYLTNLTAVTALPRTLVPSSTLLSPRSPRAARAEPPSRPRGSHNP